MAITKYSLRRPALSTWSELERNRVSRLFDDAFSTPARAGGFSPAVSIQEGPDSLALAAELPGLSEEDISIDVENHVLTISGEKEDRREESEDGRYHLLERSFGSFKRSFTLPRSIDAGAISARFDNGVLHVTLPKAAESKGRRIEITS